MKNSSQRAPESVSQAADLTELGWSSGRRTIATLGILFYLLVVVIAPLSNPVASAGFTAPIAKALSPFHQALYLGHGYRFFGPDPGPSHLVYYKLTRADGEKVEGHFPDPSENWPRLLYHRWFMLSESIFNEHRFTPDQAGFEQAQKAMTIEIGALRAAGQFDAVKRLENQRLLQEVQYRNARRRIDELVNALAAHLVSKHRGDTIELFVRERLIAGPVDVSSGVKLDDKRYLMAPISIGPGREELPLGKPREETSDR